jgi:hypothetical protein
MAWLGYFEEGKVGIEKLIPKDAEPEGIWAIQVPWKLSRPYNPLEQAIIDEALEFHLTLPVPTALGDTLIGVVDKDEQGIVTIAIGKEPTFYETHKAHYVIYPGDIFAHESRPLVSAVLCHVLMFQPDNPLKLHWRFRPGAERPTITIEGIEEINQVSEYATYVKRIGPLLERMGDLFAAGRGRPVNRVEPSAVEFNRMKRTAIELHNQRYSWEHIADKLGIDLKTLRNYRKKWGIN